MTLKERLERIWHDDPSQRVRISSGSGWMFFGDKKRFEQYWDRATEKFQGTQMQIKDRSNRTLKNLLEKPCEFDINYPDVKIPNINDYEGIKKYADIMHGFFLELEEYMILLDRYVSGLNRHRRSLITSTEYVENFTPFLDRNVLETYKALNGDEICIKIDGNEQAAYWFESEFIYEIVEGRKIENREEGKWIGECLPQRTK